MDQAAEQLATWRRSLYPSVSLRQVSGELADLLAHLEPLTGGSRPRELLVEVGPRWTAYFDCSLRGTDAVSTVGHLSRTAGCQGVAIRCVPHVAAREARPARLGAVQFEMYGPLSTEYLNYVRTVSVTFSGSKWQFSATGTEQVFEEVETYKSSRVRYRFTSDMLERYCRAIGLEPFTVASYGPNAVLLESAVSLAASGHVMTLADAQRWLGIEPGIADGLPG